jgi:hypothetical protein
VHIPSLFGTKITLPAHSFHQEHATEGLGLQNPRSGCTLGRKLSELAQNDGIAAANRLDMTLHGAI